MVRAGRCGAGAPNEAEPGVPVLASRTWRSRPGLPNLAFRARHSGPDVADQVSGAGRPERGVPNEASGSEEAPFGGVGAGKRYAVLRASSSAYSGYQSPAWGPPLQSPSDSPGRFTHR
ncbi:hypothetical protein SCWH03_01340 [Streptomyces pacificus]|uniref:Uncharacterized protein n=1 Tax=Streptomyces pacificus TaxID=2705029 RepID=A0A6A0ANQ9_9ACTN|nr:hypothetical protein SCWH03_01340 [Streptomyces pacificus]